jgi:dTDP-D-glucose 4,6-dehydratase
MIYSSTNKVYGDLEDLTYTETETRYEASGFEHGFDENLPLDFHSPYGCSKGAADQYILDYHSTPHLTRAGSAGSASRQLNRKLRGYPLILQEMANRCGMYCMLKT